MMQLSANYESLFRQMLINFCKTLNEQELFAGKEYTLFYPLIGNKYHLEKKLMVVGRACNGWTNQWNSKCTNFDEIVAKSMNGAGGNSGKCPMHWVLEQWERNGPEKSNIRKSAFWRDTRVLLFSMVDCNDTNWPEYIAWSNLFKISPVNQGNPNHTEAKIQKEECFRLFELELKELKPEYVLLMVEWDWGQEFLQFLGLESNEKPMPGIVQKVYIYDQTKIILTVRPEKITDQNFVAAVKQYL